MLDHNSSETLAETMRYCVQKADECAHKALIVDDGWIDMSLKYLGVVEKAQLILDDHYRNI